MSNWDNAGIAAITNGTQTIRKGTKVRVSKGTKVVYDMAPASSKKRAVGRTQVVTVDHVSGPAYTEVASRWQDEETGVWGSWSRTGSRDKDLWSAAEFHGIKPSTGHFCGDDAQFSAAVIALAEKVGKIANPYSHGRCQRLLLPTNEATVVWPGSGGYWIAVRAEDVEVVG